MKAKLTSIYRKYRAASHVWNLTALVSAGFSIKDAKRLYWRSANI